MTSKQGKRVRGTHRHKWVLGSIGWDGNCDQSQKYEYRCETPNCKANKYSPVRLKESK